MWGFESLLPCQIFGRRVRRARVIGEMAQATKLSKEDTGGEGASFSVPEPLSKIAGYPQRLRAFLHEVRVEMAHVNWPSRADVWSTTIVVTVTVAFFGIYFFFVDSGFSYLIQRVLKYFK
jgi:preprotein translocase subunit SecE